MEFLSDFSAKMKEVNMHWYHLVLVPDHRHGMLLRHSLIKDHLLEQPDRTIRLM